MEHAACEVGFEEMRELDKEGQVLLRYDVAEEVDAEAVV